MGNDLICRNRLLLSGVLLTGALSGYAGRAYGACTVGSPGGSTYACTSLNTSSQSINVDNANVSTASGFSVTTSSGNALRITGNGALSFTDANASSLITSASGNASASSAIYIQSNGNSGGTPGSVTVNTNGTASGRYGISAQNLGGGALAITIAGDGAVTGTAVDGITARNTGTDLTLTTAAGSKVTGGRYGIFVRNDTPASGALLVTVNGDATGGTGAGIYARDGTPPGLPGAGPAGTNLTVITATTSTVIGGNRGIFALNDGSGALTVTTNGDVTSRTGNGIYAQNRGAGLTVTTATTSTVIGANNGIYAVNPGSGTQTVTVNGDVTGTTGNGIFTRNGVIGVNLTVITAAGSTVTGGSNGISATNTGSGVLTITTNGDVTGTARDGIFAAHTVGGPIGINVGQTSTVTGGGAGFAVNVQGGPGTVTVAGALSGGLGAVQFDQVTAFNNRLVLFPTATINGNAFGGPGTDTLTLAGTGEGRLNVSQLVSFEAGEKINPGTWTLTGANSQVRSFAVNEGTLRAGATGAFFPNAQFTVASAGTLDLNGFNQTIASLTNAGIVRTGGAPPGTTLTVGNYVGQGGTLVLNTFLGTDNSPSDKLIINGGTADPSFMRVVNAGGPGAQTTRNGILVVQAINGATTASNAFALNAPVLVGPYEYDLLRGGVDGSAPDDWFLRSTFVVDPPEPPPPEPPFPPDPPPDPLPPGVYPIISPQHATYDVVQPIARQMGMTILGTLHERIGDTLTNDGHTGASGPVPSAWVRFFAQQVDNGYQAFAAPSTSGQILGGQVGLDVWHGSIFPGQRDTAGVYFAFGNANLSVDGLVTNPEATAYVRMRTGWLHQNAYAVGGYWTHYGADGWYLDAVVQHTLYRGSAQAQFTEFNFATSLPTNGSSIITSLEGGYPFALDLGPEFVLEPQAQLMWQQAKFTLANDGLELVGLGTTSGVTGRLGVRAKWTINDQDGEVWQPYARFNIWRAWGGRAATDFDNSATLVPLVEQATWGEVAAGLTFKSSDSLSLFAQAGYQFALSNNTTISGFKGSFGPRLTW